MTSQLLPNTDRKKSLVIPLNLPFCSFPCSLCWGQMSYLSWDHKRPKLGAQITACFETRDLKHRQRNGRRRRFATEADWAKGFVFGGETKFKQCSFPDRRRLFNLQFMSYDDGLMTVANLLFFTTCKLIVEAFSLSGSFCFCFEVESEYRSRTALDLKLL